MVNDVNYVNVYYMCYDIYNIYIYVHTQWLYTVVYVLSGKNSYAAMPAMLPDSKGSGKRNGSCA